MAKYKIEAGIETKRCLSTTKFFYNAQDAREFIKSLDDSVWYVVEYAKTKAEIMRHNYFCEGTQYNEYIVCPKALLGL